MTVPFPFAPWSRLVAWWTENELQAALKLNRQSVLGKEVLRIMREELGNGEEGGNNTGPHLDKYRGRWAAKGKGKAWCAAVVYYAILLASSRIRLPVPFSRTHGARKLYRLTVRRGRRVTRSEVLPGDVVLFDRGDPDRKGDRWKAHIGIVSKVEAGSIWYIAGNEGRYPAKVDEYRIAGRRAKRLIGFGRLP